MSARVLLHTHVHVPHSHTPHTLAKVLSAALCGCLSIRPADSSFSRVTVPSMALLSLSLFLLGLGMHSFPLTTQSCTPGLSFHCISFHTTSWHPTGSHYWRLDTSRDGWHSWPIAHHWPQGPSAVDAAFSWDGKVYLIQVCIGSEV